MLLMAVKDRLKYKFSYSAFHRRWSPSSVLNLPNTAIVSFVYNRGEE